MQVWKLVFGRGEHLGCALLARSSSTKFVSSRRAGARFAPELEREVRELRRFLLRVPVAVRDDRAGHLLASVGPDLPERLKLEIVHPVPELGRADLREHLVHVDAPECQG